MDIFETVINHTVVYFHVFVIDSSTQFLFFCRCFGGELVTLDHVVGCVELVPIFKRNCVDICVSQPVPLQHWLDYKGKGRG